MHNYSTKIYHCWEFYLFGKYHKLEFWDSKLSGKKKFSCDSRVVVYNQYEDDIYFSYSFHLGYTTIKVVQTGEDIFEVFIDGYRFRDLMQQEKTQKKNKQKLLEEQKKKEQEYYN